MTETFNGMQIATSLLCPEYKPILEISPFCPMTDDFRAEMNEWLFDMFGREPYVLLLEKEQRLVMNPKTLLRLKQKFMKEQKLAHDSARDIMGGRIT